jgi:hypothetical protein
LDGGEYSDALESSDTLRTTPALEKRRERVTLFPREPQHIKTGFSLITSIIIFWICTQQNIFLLGAGVTNRTCLFPFNPRTDFWLYSGEVQHYNATAGPDPASSFGRLKGTIGPG